MCFRPAAAASGGPVKCPKCGASVSASADACPSCGAYRGRVYREAVRSIHTK